MIRSSVFKDINLQRCKKHPYRNSNMIDLSLDSRQRRICVDCVKESQIFSENIIEISRVLEITNSNQPQIFNPQIGNQLKYQLEVLAQTGQKLKDEIKSYFEDFLLKVKSLYSEVIQKQLTQIQKIKVLQGNLDFSAMQFETTKRLQEILASNNLNEEEELNTCIQNYYLNSSQKKIKIKLDELNEIIQNYSINKAKSIKITTLELLKSLDFFQTKHKNGINDNTNNNQIIHSPYQVQNASPLIIPLPKKQNFSMGFQQIQQVIYQATSESKNCITTNIRLPQKQEEKQIYQNQIPFKQELNNKIASHENETVKRDVNHQKDIKEILNEDSLFPKSEEKDYLKQIKQEGNKIFNQMYNVANFILQKSPSIKKNQIQQEEKKNMIVPKQAEQIYFKKWEGDMLIICPSLNWKNSLERFEIKEFKTNNSSSPSFLRAVSKIKGNKQCYLGKPLNNNKKYIIQLQINSANIGVAYFGLIKTEHKDDIFMDDSTHINFNEGNACNTSKIIKGQKPNFIIGKRNLEFRIHIEQQYWRVSDYPNYLNVVELNNKSFIIPSETYHFAISMFNEGDYCQVLNIIEVSEFDQKM